MNKKKVDSVLKGVAAAGLAIGGVSTIQGADVVMAATLSESENQADSENDLTSDSMSDTPSESQSESSVVSVSEASSDSNNTTDTASSENESATETQKSETLEDTFADETYGVSTSEANDIQVDAGTAVTLEENGETDPVAEQENGTQKDEDLTNGIDSQSVSISEQESQLVSGSESASDSAAVEESELNSLSGSASASENSTSLSVSMEESEYLSDSIQLSESLSEAESLYNSTSLAFDQTGERDEYLEGLITNINTIQDVLNDALDANRDKTLGNVVYNGDVKEYQGQSFWDIADKLANALIQYRYYQEDKVKDIKYSDWKKGQGTNQNGNYVKVDYTQSGSNKTNSSYFDYVVTDKTGKVIYYSNKTGQGNLDKDMPADQVFGIAVLQKIAYLEGTQLRFKDSGKKPTYSTYDENGNVISNKNDGNFNVKGDYYFSTDSYKRGEDDYNKKRSELNSTSTLKSNIDESVSELKSASESLSTWNSQHQESGSQSLSTSASTSEHR
ncbi:MAG: hypothetical protein SPL66_10025, partial [Lachnospiraceae bacterium]|nr:hypothetical protein [Lachnospiraceae bacterium]